MLGIGIVKVDGIPLRRGGEEVVLPVCCWWTGNEGGIGDSGDCGCGVDDCCDSRPDVEPAWEPAVGGGCR